MDSDNCWEESYRPECFDRGACHDPDFMLACVATRDFPNAGLGIRAVRIYNEAMNEEKKD